MKNSPRIIIVGGGAAGFFAAIACAEASPDSEVTVLERTPHFLTKVRISGGGRCNVTHRLFEPRELTKRYPRGERAHRAVSTLPGQRHSGVVRVARRET